jgi:hypothetical protein
MPDKIIANTWGVFSNKGNLTKYEQYIKYS